MKAFLYLQSFLRFNCETGRWPAVYNTVSSRHKKNPCSVKQGCAILPFHLEKLKWVALKYLRKRTCPGNRELVVRWNHLIIDNTSYKLWTSSAETPFVTQHHKRQQNNFHQKLIPSIFRTRLKFVSRKTIKWLERTVIHSLQRLWSHEVSENPNSVGSGCLRCCSATRYRWNTWHNNRGCQAPSWCTRWVEERCRRCLQRLLKNKQTFWQINADKNIKRWDLVSLQTANHLDFFCCMVRHRFYEIVFNGVSIQR